MLFFNIFVLGCISTVASVPHIPTSNRIIGGEEAPYAYAPHMAALLRGKQITFMVCGGSVISTTLILTAAHCIEPFVLQNGSLLNSFHARVGSNYWKTGGSIANFKGFHIHPQWDSKNIKYDAGLLVLLEELKFSYYVQSIALNFDFIGKERSFVTGWGFAGPKIGDDVIILQHIPDELQLLYTQTISHEQCEEALDNMSAAGWHLLSVQKEVEICTFHSIGHGMCNGDSGSALVKADTREQIGIVSWGLPCAQGAPDVFVRLRGIKDFLNKYVYAD